MSHNDEKESFNQTPHVIQVWPSGGVSSMQPCDLIWMTMREESPVRVTASVPLTQSWMHKLFPVSTLRTFRRLWRALNFFLPSEGPHLGN